MVSAAVQLFFSVRVSQSVQQKPEYLKYSLLRKYIPGLEDYLAFLHATPSLGYTQRNICVWAVINALVIGPFFLLCGLCAARANSKRGACCYCCCNMCLIVFTVHMLFSSADRLNVTNTYRDWAPIFFAGCDPSICYPAGNITDPRMTVDCLTTAVWNDYVPPPSERLPSRVSRL